MEESLNRGLLYDSERELALSYTLLIRTGLRLRHLVYVSLFHVCEVTRKESLREIFICSRVSVVIIRSHVLKAFL